MGPELETIIFFFCSVPLLTTTAADGTVCFFIHPKNELIHLSLHHDSLPAVTASIREAAMHVGL